MRLAGDTTGPLAPHGPTEWGILSASARCSLASIKLTVPGLTCHSASGGGEQEAGAQVQTWVVPEGPEMCGGDSAKVTGSSDGKRDKTTPLRETSWGSGGILFGKHTQAQSVALLNGFVDYSGEVAQDS